MPAGQSITGIYNIALIELGENPITSADEQSGRAILCNARYADSRQAVIRMHPWGCCKKLAQLGASPVAPPFDWGVQYPLPADYIRIGYVADTDGRQIDDAKWEVVGNMLMTDEGAPLNVLYYFDLQDTTRFDALMVQAIGLQLALNVAPVLVRDDAKLARIQKKFDDTMSIARLSGAQEDSVQEWDADVLLRSRF